MPEIKIRQTADNELEWVNSLYRSIGFVESNKDTEFIVVAELGGKPTGIGRLVKIDDNHIELGGIYVLPSFRNQGIAFKIVHDLISKNPYENSTVWCIPFENLKIFYKKFGFTEKVGECIPKLLLDKLMWFNTESRFPKKAILMRLH